MVNENYCNTSNLELKGTATSTTLATAVAAYSDGYTGIWSISLDSFNAGAAGGWRGACIVYYTSQYVQSNINGSLCFAVTQDSAAKKGPTDYAAGYLMHVPQNTWTPPAMSAAVTPSGQQITASKYGIVYSPTSSTSRLFTAGFYASVTWYQPKYASTYVDIARFGKDDYVGAYCMQGAGSTSYFSAPAGGTKLTGAAYVAASVITLGAALSLAM